MINLEAFAHHAESQKVFLVQEPCLDKSSWQLLRRHFMPTTSESWSTLKWGTLQPSHSLYARRFPYSWIIDKPHAPYLRLLFFTVIAMLLKLLFDITRNFSFHSVFLVRDFVLRASPFKVINLIVRNFERVRWKWWFRDKKHFIFIFGVQTLINKPTLSLQWKSWFKVCKIAFGSFIACRNRWNFNNW